MSKSKIFLDQVNKIRRPKNETEKLFSNPIQPTFFLQFVIANDFFGRESAERIRKKTVFLKTRPTKTGRVKSSVNTIGHFKVSYNQKFIKKKFIQEKLNDVSSVASGGLLQVKAEHNAHRI